MNYLNGLKCLSLAGLLISAASTAPAEDRFAATVGDHDKLVFFAADGKRAAEVNAPSIAQPATVGSVSFQVSYGRDTDGCLAAILTPTAAGAPALHFNVLGKAIDASDAVVTLTFAHDLKSVAVDPGYVGSVGVNSRHVAHRHLAEDVGPGMSVPAATPAPEVATTVPVDNTASVSSNDSLETASSAASVTEDTPAPAPDISKPLAQASLASQLSPSILGTTEQSRPVAATKPQPKTVPVAADAPPSKPFGLYWSEPVTAPDGTAPACAVDEIKLVEVRGIVSIKLPTGEEKPGMEGMAVPSGSIVATRDNASAALFMGGINSARLMPHCTLTVTQTLADGTRHNQIDLDHGAVFTRVGHRTGETEDFVVKTAESTTIAETDNMLAYRGGDEDYAPVTTASLIQRHLLYAWNPAAFSRGLISDVLNPLVSAPRPGGSTTSSAPGTVFIYAPNGSQTLNITNLKSIVAASNASNGGNSSNAADPNTVLQNVLTALVPFNSKLTALLTRIDSGHASAKDLTFYHRLITVFFNSQLPGLTKLLTARTGASTTEFGILAAKRLLLQDLQPFTNPALTPF